MKLEQLKNVNRAIGIAGGSRKFSAIRGALRGKLINILVTDSCTAKKLAADF
jgi:DNA-binding transcriptional regulator LsrR (DeoR family)